MKNLKAIFTFIAIISFIQINLANNIANIRTQSAKMLVQTVSNADNYIALRLVRNTTDRLIIELKDETGSVHYFERVTKKKDYYRNFLLEDMPDGRYHFSIKTSNTLVIVKRFSLENGTVNLVNPNELITVPVAKKAYKMQMNSPNNQSIALNFENRTDKKVTLRLKDAEGKTWYFEKVKPNQNCTKNLVLSEVPNGSYKLSIDGQEEVRGIQVQDGKVRLGYDTPRA